MDKRLHLPAALQAERLGSLPIMAIGIGMDCPVEHPLTRSTDKRGLVISTVETSDGPKLLITVADGKGTALTAVINNQLFPPYLELQQRQCGRMRDLIVGAPKPGEPTNG